MQGETLDPRRTAVVFFDTLKCYAYNSDLTSVLPEARAQVDAFVRLLQLARERGLPVFYARADHRSDGGASATAITDIGLANRSREGSSRQQIWGTEAANVIDEIAPQPGDYQVPKHRWSMFFQTDLELSLRSRDIDTILLAGGSTEVGVGSSVYAGRDLDFRTILVRETMRSGRGTWVSDTFVDLVAPTLARVRTLDQVARMLGGDQAPSTPPRSEPATSAAAAASIAGTNAANDPPLDPRETGILFCDFLKGGHYDADTGKLAAHSQAHVGAMQRLFVVARRLGLPLFYTRPIHRADGADWCSAWPDHERRPMVEKFGRMRINPGSFAGAERTEVIDELAPNDGDYIIRKHRFSGFHGTPLELSLRRAGVKNVLMGGSSVSAVVASSAYAARDRDFNVVMLRDAVHGSSPQMEDYFMDHVFPRLGRVRTVDQAIALLGGK